MNAVTEWGGVRLSPNQYQTPARGLPDDGDVDDVAVLRLTRGDSTCLYTHREMVAAVITMCQQGVTVTEQANRIGCSRDRINHIRSRHHVRAFDDRYGTWSDPPAIVRTYTKRPPRTSLERARQVRDLRGEGRTTKQIATHLGMGVSTVHKIIHAGA